MPHPSEETIPFACKRKAKQKIVKQTTNNEGQEPGGKKHDNRKKYVNDEFRKHKFTTPKDCVCFDNFHPLDYPIATCAKPLSVGH